MGYNFYVQLYIYTTKQLLYQDEEAQLGADSLPAGSGGKIGPASYLAPCYWSEGGETASPCLWASRASSAVFLTLQLGSPRAERMRFIASFPFSSRRESTATRLSSSVPSKSLFFISSSIASLPHRHSPISFFLLEINYSKASLR